MPKKIGDRNYRKPTGKAKKLEGLITEKFDDPAAAKKLGYTVDNIETGVTSASPLYKDKEYVKILENAINSIKKGYKNKATYLERGTRKLLDTTLYNRSINALLAQPDKAFLKVLQETGFKDPGVLAFKIKQFEDQVLRKYQPVVGMEGHHILTQNTMGWMRDINVEKALQVMDKVREQMGSGVSVDNLKYGSKLTHRGMSSPKVKGLISEAAEGRMVSAHVNPITGVDDTKFFTTYDRLVAPDVPVGKGQYKAFTRFKKTDSIDFMVDTILNQAGEPGKLFAKALDSGPEQLTKQYYRDLLGKDIFNMTGDPTLMKKYKHLLNELKLNYNDVFTAFAQGRKPKPVDKVFSSNVRKVIQNLNNNPALSEDKITAALKKSSLFKKVIKIGAATTVGTIGFAFDTLAAQQGISEAADEEAGLGKKIVGGLRATSGVSGIARLSGVAAPVAVPVSLLTGVTAEILDSSLNYAEKGGRKRGDAKFSLLGDIPGTDSYKRLQEKWDKEDEEKRQNEQLNLNTL